jgi:hypothetical protein
MRLFSRLLGRFAMTNTGHVKRILREATGASDFLRRVAEFGFAPDGNSLTGQYYRKDECIFVITVLPSYGSDRIFCLLVTEKNVTKGNVCLVDEGVPQI